MFGWLRRKPRLMVGLVMYDGDICIVHAYEHQCGLMARWTNSKDQWSILKPDGTCDGTSLVKRWVKISGFTE